MTGKIQKLDALKCIEKALEDGLEFGRALRSQAGDMAPKSEMDNILRAQSFVAQMIRREINA